MTPCEFLRARKPGQKEERRAHLLAVARELLAADVESQELSLNELARHAGMAKSNVYRYFESREAVLLELLRQEWELWARDLRQALACEPENAPARELDGGRHAGTGLEDIAAGFARTAARRPLLCELSSILPSIIERNVSAQTIRDFKRALLMLVQELALLLHGRVPSIPEAAFAEFAHHAFAYMTGLWPLCHPSALAAQVLEEPEFEPFRRDFERDFARGLSLLLRGLERA